MAPQNQTTPENTEIEGPIEIHFTDKGSIQTAEGLPVNLNERFATVPKGAKINLRTQGISISHNGKGYNWGLNSIKAVIQNGRQIQQW